MIHLEKINTGFRSMSGTNYTELQELIDASRLDIGFYYRAYDIIDIEGVIHIIKNQNLENLDG